MTVVPFDEARARFGTIDGRTVFFDELPEYTGNVSPTVLVVDGDVVVDGDLRGTDLVASVPGTSVVVVAGSLTVRGCLSNWRGGDRRNINLLVLGDVHARSFISTQATTFVRGDLRVEDVIYLFYDDGTSVLDVAGSTTTRVFVVNDEHRERTTSVEEHYLDLYHCDPEEVDAALVDEVLGPPDSKVDHDTLVRLLEAGVDICRRP
ncbi:MAG: hypothetical protein ACRCY9_10825 [Phycicoccus sp.]